MGDIFFPSEHQDEVWFGVVCSSFGWTVYSRVAAVWSWWIFWSTDACELLPASALQHVYWPPADVCTWPTADVCTGRQHMYVPQYYQPQLAAAYPVRQTP